MFSTRVASAVGLVSKQLSLAKRANGLGLKSVLRCYQALPKAPLEGLRILDMSRVLSGPYATMILGDYGAEIIKVERPGLGDDTRAFGPPFCEDQSVYFMSINRNKRSVCVDFKTKKGADLIKKLAQKSDVLIENFMPGKLAEMGLGYDQVKEVAPNIIYCSVTGYGQSGPYANRGGYDVTAAAIGGLMHITGEPEGDPCRVGVAITDITTGLYAHGAIMAALLEREKTGQGRYIDCSLLASQVAVLSHLAGNYLNSNVEATRIGAGHHNIVPYQAFKTKDGNMVVVAGNDGQFRALCRRIDMEHLLDDDRFKTNGLRVQNRRVLVPLIQERLMQEKTSHWLTTFENGGFPFGSINTMSQVFEDPQVKHLGMIQEIPHSSVGTLRLAGPAVAFDGTSEMKKPLPPPLLGEHTREVLQEVLNLEDGFIDELEDHKIIACME
ncbi:succinate--hydroxymethylglutarate CoA-transferase-like [Rhopilema esculentum]|uniref:succinate--hydroxymethylglutarate CoA-transferase-like n=1 Tax=Rhopilema esculentum TaxID=499914 RepID=UPI0031D0AB1B|eukprot:gene9178-16847_t